MKYSYKDIIKSIPETTRLALIIFFSALFIHFIYIAFAGWGKDLLSPYVFSDEYFYLHRAWHMAFIDPAGGYLGEILSVTPYSRLLTWAYQIFGDGFWIPLFVNAILMSFAVMFNALLTRQLFDQQTAWIAGFIGVFCGPFVFFAGLTYKTNIVMFFLAAGLYFAVRYLKTRSLQSLFLASLLILASSVERYQLIFIIVVLCFFIFWPMWKSRDFNLMARSALVMVFSFIIVFLSVGQGQQKSSNVVSPLGVNVYAGYGPGAWGGYTPIKSVGNDILSHRLNTKRVAEKEAGKELTDWGVQWHWIRKVISYYSSVPQDLLILQLRKTGLLFAQAVQGQPEEHRVWRWHRPALVIALVDFGMIISLFLFSLYHLRSRKSDRTINFLFYSIAAYAFGVWIFFIQERYRLPIMLMLIPFAAYGLNKLIKETNMLIFAKSISVLFFIYGMTFLLNQLNHEGAGWSENHEKTRAIQTRRSEMEFKVYRLKKIALEANNEKSWLNLAVWFNRRGFYPDAISYAKRAIEAAPESFKGYDLLLETYIRTKDFKALSDLKNNLEKSDYFEENKHIKSIVHRIDKLLQFKLESEKNIYLQDREQVRDIIRKR